MFIVNFLPHGHQTSHVPNSSRLIELHYSHCPFTSSCAIIDLSSISSPMQITNHPLVALSILIYHTPPTSSPYYPLTFHVNVGSQPYIFLNPFNHAHLRHFPFLTLLVLIVGCDRTPQPTPISSICLQPSTFT